MVGIRRQRPRPAEDDDYRDPSMLRLTVDELAWRSHVGTWRDVPGLVPVVKGNGYGFGRATLARAALELGVGEVAVGTAHELADVAAVAAGSPTAVVALTPAVHLPASLPPGSVLTVGSPAHVHAAVVAGHRGPVAVKLESSMHRHGAAPERLDELLGCLRRDRLPLHEAVLHLPLATSEYTDQHALAEIDGWIARLDPSVPLSLSHLSRDAFGQLVEAHPHRTLRLRAGTALWHGDKAFLHLEADVLDIRPVRQGEPVGYRRRPAPAAGHLLMIGAGTAHGVTPLDGGASPFHHARRRLALVEPPHMHTSMVLVPAGEPLPCSGDWVDVQRPLTAVIADEVTWR
jgi:alanine racemase